MDEGAIGRRIRERRVEIGRTQADLAAAAAISASYLALIEGGRRRAPLPLLDRIARALGTDRAVLRGRVDPALLDVLRVAAGEVDPCAKPTEDPAEFARRMPGWAATVAALLERLVDARAYAETLSERATHDPHLAATLHEIRTAAAGIRSTASIIVGTPELDRAWSDRFLSSLDADARRLAAGAEALAVQLDPAADTATQSDAVPAEPRRRDDVAGVEHPTPPPAQTLERRAAADPRAALLVVDASGAPLVSRPVAGFPLLDRGCPRWPVFTALARPLHPVSTQVETPDGALWWAEAAVDTVAWTPHGPILEATMLVMRDEADTRDPIPVGPSCRVCPRADCPARRDAAPIGPGWTPVGNGD